MNGQLRMSTTAPPDECLDAAQAHVDAEPEQRVLIVVDEIVSQIDDGRVLAGGKGLELPPRLGEHLPAIRSRLRHPRREACFVCSELVDEVVEVIGGVGGIALCE